MTFCVATAAAVGIRKGGSSGTPGIMDRSQPDGMGGGRSLTTPYGVWSWDQQYAEPGINPGEENGWAWVKLNNKFIKYSSLNQVAYGNNLFVEAVDANITFALGYAWQFCCSGTISDPGTEGPLPTGVVGNTPFMPSPDGTTITCPTSSTIKSVDGVWGCGANVSGANYQITLNGIVVISPGFAPSFAGAQIVINSNGNAFVHAVDGLWYVFLQYAMVNSANGSNPGPIPIGGSFSPVSMNTSLHAVTPSPSPAGTLVATVTIQMSDGSAIPPADLSTTPLLLAPVTVQMQAGTMNVVLSRTLDSSDLTNANATHAVIATVNGVALTILPWIHLVITS